MTAPDPQMEADGRPVSGPDAWAGVKVAGLALVAWAVIGVGLRLTSGFDFAEGLGAAALLLPALVGMGISAQGILHGHSKFQATVGLMVNAALAVGAIILALSGADGP